MSSSVLQRLSEPDLVALRISGDAWPRSLTSPTLIPDAWMGLIRRRNGNRLFMPAGEEPRLDRDDTLLLVRNRAIETPVTPLEARSADGYLIRAQAQCLLRWPARESDLAALGDALRADDGLRLGGLADWLDQAGTALAVRRFIQTRPAANLIENDQREPLLEALRTDLRKWLFEIGLTLERVAAFELQSSEFHRHQARERDQAQRLAQIQSRELVEQAALAATQKRLADLSGIFEKLRSAAASNGNMQWHDLLPSLSPAERGRLLENLWRITPDERKTRAIVAIGGDEVIWLDPASPESAMRRLRIGKELGGLRSVSYDEPRNALLIGAAAGVWLLDAESGESRAKFIVPDAGAPKTGFNAAVFSAAALFATHSQLGCWTWPESGTEIPPRALLKPQSGLPRAIRGVCTLPGDRIAFAADDVVLIFSAAGDEQARIPAAGHEIQSLRACDAALFAGTTAGFVLEAAADDPQSGWRTILHSPVAVESLQPRRWNDLIEIVVPGGPAGITGVYGAEGTATRLVNSTTPIRRAWAGDDLLVGLNDRRDKLLVATASMPERTGREIPLARLLSASIQDVSLVTTKG